MMARDKLRLTAFISACVDVTLQLINIPRAFDDGDLAHTTEHRAVFSPKGYRCPKLV